VGVDSVVMIKVLKRREITSVNKAAVGVDELPQLELVNYFLR
jgi:hypothetical protein